ncbi:hypothetical protein BDN72DRAFT_890582 [Pluteus cervinus]|uniref:Uncharacterized protein n=1 Tax=Pluteus cervinus TaxID=181527 RepID=A0ACD3BFT1_9AGAR|nr:hypothetical protein BDN72DRAFT_890582 [Pluteus cervinus]
MMFFDLHRLAIFSLLVATAAALPVAEPAPVAGEDLRRGNSDWRRGNSDWRRGNSDWRRGNSDWKREELGALDNSA